MVKVKAAGGQSQGVLTDVTITFWRIDTVPGFNSSYKKRE